MKGDMEQQPGLTEDWQWGAPTRLGGAGAGDRRREQSRRENELHRKDEPREKDEELRRKNEKIRMQEPDELRQAQDLHQIEIGVLEDEGRYREGVGNLRAAEQMRILEEEEILLKSRARLERRASNSEDVSGEQTEGRSGQTLASGNPSEGLSSGTIGTQLDEQRSLHRSQERQPQALPETETGARAEAEGPPPRAPAIEELDSPPQPGNEGQFCGCRCLIM